MPQKLRRSPSPPPALPQPQPPQSSPCPPPPPPRHRCPRLPLRDPPSTPPQEARRTRRCRKDPLGELRWPYGCLCLWKCDFYWCFVFFFLSARMQSHGFFTLTVEQPPQSAPVAATVNAATTPPGEEGVDSVGPSLCMPNGKPVCPSALPPGPSRAALQKAILTQDSERSSLQFHTAALRIY